MKMLRKNHKGGAAAVAIMVIIMIVAIASAVLIVTGRFSIKKSNVEQTVSPVQSKPDQSSETISESDLSSVAEPAPINLYPTLAADYQDVNIKGLTAGSSILVDADTNEIVAGFNYEKKIYPASLTKILTLMVAVENIDDMSATYTFTDDDIDPLIEDNASMAGFEAGESVTMEDLLYASILVSGADGTIGLANSIAGSEEAFVALMQQKLKDLGLDSTTNFVNASGLHNKNHYTTVQDIAVLTRAALESETCRKVLTASTYTTGKTEQHPDGIELTSIVASRFEGYFIDCDGDGEADSDVEILGGKTGFTDEALYTLSSVIEKGGHRYICVVARSKSEFDSVEDAIAIYEKYLGPNKTKKTELNIDTETEEDTDDTENDTDTQKVDEGATVKVENDDAA